MADELEAPGTLRHTLSRDQLEELRFRESIHALRKEQGLSQGEVARRMVAEGWEHFNQATVSRIEKGTRPVRIGEARALTRILGTEVSALLGESETSQRLSEFWRVHSEALEHQERIKRNVREWTVAVQRLRRLLDALDVEKALALLPNDKFNRTQLDVIVAQARRMTKRDIGEFARAVQSKHEVKTEPADD